MSLAPDNLRYTQEHEWVETIQATGRVRVGITDFAQSALGDIVYVQLPNIGDQLVAGKVCGEVESTKSVSEIYAPVSGVVVAINTGLSTAPESLNSSPYAQGWMFELENVQEPNTLLDAKEYQALTA